MTGGESIDRQGIDHLDGKIAFAHESSVLEIKPFDAYKEEREEVSHSKA